MDKIVFDFYDKKPTVEIEIFELDIAGEVIRDIGGEKFSGLQLTFYTKEEIIVADQLGRRITIKSEFGDYTIEEYRKEKNTFYEDMVFYSADTLWWTSISPSGERRERTPSRADLE